MNKYILYASQEFTKDMADAYDYISIVLENKAAAKALMKEIKYTIMSLEQMPKRYPLCPEPLDVLGLRKIVIKNHVILFSVDDQKMEVNLIRCFYGRQDYGRYFE